MRKPNGVYGSVVGTLDRVRTDLDECGYRPSYDRLPLPTNTNTETKQRFPHIKPITNLPPHSKQGQTDPTDNLSDPSYPTPAYPPPVSQQPQGNPYAAQQTYTAVPGMGSNSNPAPQVQQGGYSAAGAYQQYGQQDGYDTVGGREPVQQVGMNGAGGSDFWAEVSRVPGRMMSINCQMECSRKRAQADRGFDSMLG
jgi:hypothetical protein